MASKFPARIFIVGDDLPIEVDGVAYHPHKGERVEFKTRPPQAIDDYLTVLRFQDLQARMNTAAEAGSVSKELTDEYEQMAAEKLAELAAAIVSWDWTNDDGDPYPNPPDVATLRGLWPEEMAWLRSKGFPRRTQGLERDDTPPSPDT